MSEMGLAANPRETRDSDGILSQLLSLFRSLSGWRAISFEMLIDPSAIMTQDCAMILSFEGDALQGLM